GERVVTAPAIEKPASPEELAQRLKDAAGQKLAVVPVGGGRASGMGEALERCDVLLHTTRLDRVIEHSQADMVVSVEAGITLEALQQELAKAGQFLPLDPFNSPGHTIGGLLATGWTAATHALSAPGAPSALELDSKGRVLARYTGSRDAVSRVIDELGWKAADRSVWDDHARSAPATWARIAVPREELRRAVQALP